MADRFNIPEGVQVPVWFRRFMEARAYEAGPANIPPPSPVANISPPPVAEVPPPPQHPQEDFAKLCKDFKAMGCKNFVGTETSVEA